MQPRGQCDTGVDAGSHDTALKRAEPGRPGRGRVRSLAARGLAGLLAAIVAALVALPLQAQAQTTPNDCPADTDWCATLQVGYLSTGNDPKNEVWGYRRDAQEDYGDLSQVMFSHGGINYTVAYLYRLKTTFGGITTLSDDLHLDVGLLDLPDDTVLQLGSRTFTVDAGSDNVTPGQEKWNLQGNPLVWIAEQHVTVSLKFPSPPTAAGVTVSKTALTVTEEDATGGSYTVVLDTQPMADVVVTVAGYAGTDVTPAPTTLTFTTLNWEMAQTVTVTAGNDANTANETVSLTHSATSTDTDYSGITIAGVTVTVTDNDTANAAPAFTSAATFDAAENQTAVGTVVASDSDTDDSVTGYAIQGGADASTFSIVPATGVLTFASAPNFEAPADADTDNGYVVVMRATSGTGARVKTADQTITVTVTDVAGEAPGVPAAPLVSAASVTSVTAAWTTPANAGPPITDYDYRYRVTSPQGAWTEVTGTTITALGATITGLAEDTGYDVQVRATTDEGTSGWSASGSGSTDANAAPTFTSAATFDAAENQTAVGTVQASDSDTDDTVTGYAIQGGADRSTFSIVETTGVLTFASAPNFEAPADADTDNAYVVVVRATSGTGDRAKTADQTITVTVTDVAGEAPGVPDAPMVTAASATSVTAAWTAPANAGPPITDYDYRYRVTAPQGPWTEVTTTAITGLSATITGLAEDTGYDVQVRATTDEGTSGWSASGSGSTDANAAPTFTSAATFDAAENQTAVGTVQASDSDTDDTVTGYAIQGGADRSTFSIVETTGVLTFASAPNFEAPADADTDNAYVVVVRATSGTGDRAKTADQTITVTVTDVAGEAPGVPDAPMVTAASATSVTAAWTAPANAGPPITDYDYRYRVTAPQGPWTEVTTTAITGLSATITGLAEDTEYDVQVRATTDEGTSGWSGSGSGSTNANNTPATGQPTISGVAQVGSLLTAGKGTIADVNGTTKADNGDSGYAYTYQWIRVDGGTETNISGATSSTYTPVDDDEGKKIKVRVSFQDDADHSESRTSAATVAVTVEDNDTAQVTGVTIAEGNAQLVVRWTAVDNATGYTVQWKSDLQENYNTGDRQARVTPGSTTSHTISGLANDTEYTVQVGANRTGAPDGQWSVEMPGKPVMPTGAGVTVSKTALTVTEEDATGGSYTVVLDTQPTADVTVTVAGHAGTDVTPAPATLLFMTATWNVAQTVTVTAANDADTANDTVTLTHSAASTDADYSAITIADVAVTVEDNDTALAVTVTPGDAQLVVAWTAVDTATGYTVQWKSDSGATRVTVTPGSTRRYTIRGLTNDTEYTVQVIANRTGASDVPSAEVTGKPAPPTKAGVTVSKTALTVTEEDATGGSYTVVLDTQPTADVTVTVAGHAGTDVTPAPATLLFMTATWNVAQTVTVTAANDADTANDTVTLTHSAASTDADYSAITIADVAVTVEDNDTALAVTVTPGDAQLVVAWTAVDTATGYTVQWKSDSGATRVTVTPGSTRRYTIRGLTNDTEYTVQVIANRTGASDVPSAEVTGKPAPPTKAGVTVSKTALTVTEEDATGGSYTVVLDTQPTADVTVTVAGHAGTDVTPAPATLLFMTATWNVAQTVTVTAANDADTANDTVTLTHSAASTDADYSAITIADVAVTVEDNDTALAGHGHTGRRAAGGGVDGGGHRHGLHGAVEVGQRGHPRHGHAGVDQEVHDPRPHQRHGIYGAGDREPDRRQ